MRVISNRLVRSLAGVAACLCLCAGPTSAQYVLYDNLPGSPPPPSNNTSGAINNSFSSLVGSNAITSLVAEDISMSGLPVNVARVITQFDFVVTNLHVPDPNPTNRSHPGAGQADIQFRPRVRIWSSNALGNAPTQLLGAFDMPATTLPGAAPGSYSSALLSLDLTPFGGVSIPNNTPNIWIGLVFDDMDGTLAPAGISDADRVKRMNNLGMFIHNPINKGSSADQLWGTTRGDSFAVNNPEGGLFNSADARVSFPLNLAFRVSMLTIPEPGTGALAVTAILPLVGVMLRRRTRRTIK